MATLRVIAVLAAVSALGACSEEPVADVIEANVRREGANQFVFDWSRSTAPVDVYVAERPNSPPAERRLIVDDDIDGHASVSIQSDRRPYFLVTTDDGGGVWTAERVLPLEGGQNFRDLGGYRTSDDRTVRWGLLYRSGSMHHLTAKDFEYIRRLGIKTVCDLRDTGERSKEPVAWPGTTSPKILAADYSIEGRGLGIPETVKPRNAAEARKVMRDQYAKMLPRFAPQYREMFQELLAGDAPLAFNCSAGKDRTGVAAALLLTALGVPRPTVMEDYLLSNRYLDADRAIRAGKQGPGGLKALPDDVLKVYLSVDPEFLGAVFEIVDAHEGGIVGYLRDELGLGSAEIEKLRGLYTEA